MWNVTDKSRRRETRFTGWADVPASPLGREQARSSGRCLESLGLTFDAVFTSLLSRSRVTYEHMLQEMPSQRKLGVPVVASWRLNERHYGALVGLSKSEAEERMGRQKVMGWRRSWELRPPPMVQHPFYHATSSDPTDKAPLFDWQSEIWTKALTIRRSDWPLSPLPSVLPRLPSPHLTSHSPTPTPTPTPSVSSACSWPTAGSSRRKRWRSATPSSRSQSLCKTRPTACGRSGTTASCPASCSTKTCSSLATGQSLTQAFASLTDSVAVPLLPSLLFPLSDSLLPALSHPPTHPPAATPSGPWSSTWTI